VAGQEREIVFRKGGPKGGFWDFARPEDPREIFAAGAAWWATKSGQALSGAVVSESERYFPEGRIDHPEGLYGRRAPEGAWPVTYLGRAFVEGAKWQEYAATAGTMWQSDQREAEEEAARLYPL
jgi:hypothetical protein